MSPPARSPRASGVEEGTPLPRSIVEFYYKNDKLGDPMVTEEHITAFGWANPQELDDIMSLALRINDFLSGLFLGVGIRLVDFKMRVRPALGERPDAHRASPTRSRLIAAGCGTSRRKNKLDKDRFRRDMGGLVESLSGGRAQARAACRQSDAGEDGPGAGALEIGLRLVKARITITLKPGVLDPQGKAIEGALHALGFGSAGNVRQGKYIEVEVAEKDPARGARRGRAHVQGAPRQHHHRELRL